MSTSHVFTTEFIKGIPVDQCVDLDDEHRSFVAFKILDLCLLELFRFQYMQTDPNWANFMYDPENKRVSTNQNVYVFKRASCLLNLLITYSNGKNSRS